MAVVVVCPRNALRRSFALGGGGGGGGVSIRG